MLLSGAVQVELSSPGAPQAVQQWIANAPSWLAVVETQDHESIAGVHKEEAAAIALAISLGADLLLMDDRKGVKAAYSIAFLQCTQRNQFLCFAAELLNGGYGSRDPYKKPFRGIGGP